MTQRSTSRLKWLWWFSFVFLVVVSWILFQWGGWKSSKKPKPNVQQWTPQQSLRSVAPFSINDQGKAKPLLRAISFSLKYLRKLPSQRQFIFGKKVITTQEMIATLQDVKTKLVQWGLTQSFFLYLSKNYTFYESTAPKVLFTGYFEASLRGSLTRGGVYQYPLYRKPNDLVRFRLRRFPFVSPGAKWPRRIRARLTQDKQIIPYYSRIDIDDKKKLAGRGLELVWIDNPVDVFFLHIQGSGIVTLPNGKTMRVNYADQNGHPYKAIGRYMLEKKMLERGKISMQSIKAYLKKHPKQLREILNYNQSYIFFRQVQRGPQGSLGVPVTAYRSIATDRRLFPKGALSLIQTKIPTFDTKGKKIGEKSMTRLVMNQDTGGAIRGPGRVDLFTGYGSSSELVAGHLQSHGKLFFLLKK